MMIEKSDILKAKLTLMVAIVEEWDDGITHSRIEDIKKAFDELWDKIKPE